MRLLVFSTYYYTEQEHGYSEAICDRCVDREEE
jgi:hypothetical protein